MTDFAYAGSELGLFAAVYNWKAYWSREVRSFIAGDILEVGAGIGSNTKFLDNGMERRWVCLEPDAHLAASLRENLASRKWKPRIRDRTWDTRKPGRKRKVRIAVHAVRCGDWTFPALQSPDAAGHFSAWPSNGMIDVSGFRGARTLGSESATAAAIHAHGRTASFLGPKRSAALTGSRPMSFQPPREIGSGCVAKGED